MRCVECGVFSTERDFYAPDMCYMCQYTKKKREIFLAMRKNTKCKFCGKQLPKGKWAYCSKPCAYEGKKKIDKTYWYRSKKK